MGGERGADPARARQPPSAARGAQGRARRPAGAAHGRKPRSAPTRWCRPRSTPSIAADGTPQTIAGSILAQGGSIGDPDDPEHRIPITTAEFGLDWDIARRTLRVPFKVTAGAARYTLRSEFAAPAQPGGNWQFALGGGWVVLDPLTPDDEGLVLKRVVVRGNIDPAQQRITLEHGDLGTKELGSAGRKDVTVALSGKFDYGAEPRLALGIAGNPDVGRRAQAAVAGLPRAEGARLGGPARRQRQRRAARHRHQRHDRRIAAERTADARGGACRSTSSAAA